jgi:hypothetical protein
VVDEVVLGGRADERGELGDLREGEQRVVVAEEGLPFLAVLTPPGGPQRDEVARREGELDRDDVAGHGESLGGLSISVRPGATPS